MKLISIISAASIFAALATTMPVMAANDNKTAIRNIIYMIPDGGGMEPFYLADALKQAGGWDRNVYPYSTVTEKGEMYAKKYLVGAVTTYSANADVTDSAAAGTALSTGYKTKNNYVGIDPDKLPHANILEAAQSVGKNVGMVTTYEWTNATPAAFSAHEKERGNYAPMSEQIVNQGIDVVLGGGFDAAKWGDIKEAEIRGYNIMRTKEDLLAVKPGDKLWSDIVSGAFPYDVEYTTEETPHIAEMTKAAITALDDGGEEGFFLMVEGSKVDGGGHANYSKGMVGEFLAFDEACRVALQYAEGRDDTIVVIVPDHDTGGMVLPEDIGSVAQALKKGIEPENVTWESTSHTARNGGLFMYIPEGIEYPEGISGRDIGTHKAFSENVIDNTVIAHYLAEAIGVDLDILTKELFVDITDMGTYNEDIGLFSFNDYPITVKSNVSYAFIDKDIADLKGQITAYINGRFYAPQILLDIAEGKTEYEICEYAYPISATMNTYMPDATDINKWNSIIKVSSLMPGEKFDGKIRFTYPESFAELDEIEVSVDEKSVQTYEFECPRFDTNELGLTFEYDITGDDGKTYSFKSSFNGLAYAGYANDEVKIDGSIDEEVWKNSIVMSCNDASQLVMIEDWKGDRDLSADFSILWDEENFYMYAVVKDEDFAPHSTVAKLYDGDSIQFGIYNDTEGNLVKGTAGTKYEEIGIAYIDEKPSAFRYISQKDMTERGEIAIGEGFDFACKREGDELTYELKFKWTDLFGYDYIPKVGDVLGFSALINDNDGGGRRGWMEYGSGIGVTKSVSQFVMMPLLDFSKGNEEIKIYVNDKKVVSDIAPVITDDRVLIPVRAIFEALGAEVLWDEETKTVISVMGEDTVTMKIGDKKLDVNGEIKELDVAAQIVKDRTLVLVRAVSESFGCDVLWDANSKTITIAK